MIKKEPHRLRLLFFIFLPIPTHPYSRIVKQKPPCAVCSIFCDFFSFSHFYVLLCSGGLFVVVVLLEQCFYRKTFLFNGHSQRRVP